MVYHFSTWQLSMSSSWVQDKALLFSLHTTPLMQSRPSALSPTFTLATAHLTTSHVHLTPPGHILPCPNSDSCPFCSLLFTKGKVSLSLTFQLFPEFLRQSVTFLLGLTLHCNFFFPVSSNRLRAPGAKALLTHPPGSCSINVCRMNSVSLSFSWILHKYVEAAT